MHLVLPKKEIEKQDISYFVNCKYPNTCIFNPGEHYRLLHYISKTHIGKIFLDLGTCTGHSALALAQEASNTVLTYDINNFDDPYVLSYGNIVFQIGDALQLDPDVINRADLILLDIDPHDGIQEAKFIEKLIKIGFKGILICDDIFLNVGMKEWWDSVTLPKYDLTSIGHGTGTGLISFGNWRIEIV